MSGISGKGTPPRLPDAPLREKALAGPLLYPGKASGGLRLARFSAVTGPISSSGLLESSALDGRSSP
jgi:hypothetical protein